MSKRKPEDTDSISACSSTTVSRRTRRRRRRTKDDGNPRLRRASKKSLRKLEKACEQDAYERKKDTRLKPQRITKLALQHALDIGRYHLYDRACTCNTAVLRKISKQVSKLRVTIGKEGFDGRKSITIIPFLIYFRKACNNADVHEGASVWLLMYFLQGTA